MPSLLPALLALAIASVDASADIEKKPFRTEAPPRMDPIFGDVASLREAIDHFFVLHAEMEAVRDELAAAVHATLAQLGPIGRQAAKSCPPEVLPLYARTSEAGRRFLALGRKLATRLREIRRAEQLGDTVGIRSVSRVADGVARAR